MKYGQFLLVVFAALLLLFPMVKARADNGTPNDLEQAIKALRSADPAVAEKAAEALGRMRDPRAIGPLIAAVRDGSMDLCKAAARALKEIDNPGALEPLVIAGLASSRESDTTFMRVGQALEILQDHRAFDRVVPALRDHDEKIRRNAAYVLGRLSDPRAIEPLSIALLKDDNPQVRSTIAVAFGRSRDRRAVEPLLVALRDSQVAPDAARSLGLIGDPIAIPALIAALRTAETEYVQGCVAGALGRIGDPRAAEPLIDAVVTSEKSELFDPANRALTCIESPAIDAFLARITRERDLDKVSKFCPLFIARGIEENLLVEAFRQVNWGDMGEQFLVSGNPRLVKEAENWSAKHGVKISRLPHYFDVRWGQKPLCPRPLKKGKWD